MEISEVEVTKNEVKESEVEVKETHAEEEKPEKESNTPYDDAFRVLTRKCSKILLFLLNDVFGKNYTGDEEIIYHPTDHHMTTEGELYVQNRYADSAFSVIYKGKKDKYMMECQTKEDDTILVRLFEYALQEAFGSKVATKYALKIKFPHLSILYLCSAQSIPDEMPILVETPRGDFQFEVPVIKIKDYTLQKLFEKRLYFLFPFYIFRYDRKLASYNKNSDKLAELKQEYEMILNKLEEAYKNHEIDGTTLVEVERMIKLVFQSKAKNYKNIIKGGNEVMNNRPIFESASEQLLDQGRREGRIEGRMEGRMEERQSFARWLREEHKDSYETIARATRTDVSTVKQWLSDIQ